jgi:flagellar basal-body rod protein FlgG
MNNNRPLSTRKTIQVLVILTILAGATQTMVRQVGLVNGTHLLLAGVLSSGSDSAMPGYHFEQGRLENTGNALDVAIDGGGFFRVRLAAGLRPQYGYTRVGQFFVNNANRLVLGIGGGIPLVPAIVIPTGVTDITISPDGVIRGVRAGQIDPSVLGQFKLTRFPNPDGLQEIQDDIYQPTSDSGSPADGKPDRDGFGRLTQGFLESLAGK